MQIGFYYDQSRCIGCDVCSSACRSWNELTPEMPDIIELVSRENGVFPEVSLTHLFLTCFHCAEPSCIPACPDRLLVKRAEDGIVVIPNPEKCTACQLCVEACPYNAPRMVDGGKVGMVKCDMCLARLDEGKAPACVASCPVEALDAGPMEELIAKYGEFMELEGFADYRQTRPSIIFRARDSGRGLDTRIF